MTAIGTRTRALLLGAAALVAAPVLDAQRVDTVMGGRARELGGHRFVPSRVVADPFVASRFGSAISFGGARDLDVPIYNAEDSLLRVLNGDLGFLGIDLDYQQQVTDWLALRGAVGAVARLGVDEFALAAEGVSTVYGFGLGASARIWRSERFLVTAVLDYTTNSLFAMQPLTYLQGVAGEVRGAVDSVLAGGGTVDSATIDSILAVIDLSQYQAVQSGTATRSNVGLRAAYAASPWLGFTVATQSGVGELLDRSSDIGIIDLGGSASIDLDELWKVPIGVALAFRFQNIQDRSTDLGGDVTTFSGFVSYAARRDLALGLEITSASLTQPTGGTLRISRLSVNSAYYF
jgi:hypothetical protein